MKKIDIINCSSTKDELIEVVGQGLEKKNLLLGNKVIATRVANDNVYYISKYKELLYSLGEGTYLTLSDISKINQLLINLGLDEDWNIDQYRIYTRSRNIITFTEQMTEDKDVEDGSYVTYVQSLYEYGFDPYQNSYKEIIEYLRSINDYLKRHINKNIKKGCIDQSHNFPSIVKTGYHDFDETVTLLNNDTDTGYTLSKIYQDRFHL